ncbi:hypothetical protein PPYR_09728 [Photinus pyralis]|uniref:EndoU domain-containing protein n=1 Tax=Photinus pyralis TaxID=7054 RepID=A0A1Y1LQD3_PHOPY|nr:poly(U)-specific endoribonuclease homolog [Photinus pyralis]KAB0795667.1 hypothetical protein PPYR_09728 [Photinus pyralis]
MDPLTRIVSYTLLVGAVIITEVYCRNSTGHGHNVTYTMAQVLSNKPPQQRIESSFNSNIPVWVHPHNATNPRIDAWSDSRSIRRPHHYTNNSRIPVYSNLGHKKEEPHRNASVPKYDVADDELRNFAEEVLRRDDNNAHRYLTVNYQGKTTSRSDKDLAPEPLLRVHENVNRIPTISKIRRLYDNYIPLVENNEEVTGEEMREEDELLDAIISTNVMDYTRNFLVSKGVIGNDPLEFKNVLKEMWFTLYPRRKGRYGSSGFEHVFLAEIKNGEVSGFHNWIYFHHQELNNNVNYLGYLKVVEFGNKGAILKHHFTFNGYDKPVDSLFIGTSPEFEMALYSTCFLIRPDKVCPLQLEGKKFTIRVFTFNSQGKKLIGSAFPEI